MKNVNIKKNKYELQEHFLIRKKFISIMKPSNKNDFILANNLSHIFINSVFLKCKYESRTHVLIHHIIQSSKNKSLINILKNKRN